jgi:penicillin-binding protein 2
MSSIWKDESQANKRQKWFFAMIILVGIILLGRMFYLQILNGSQYDLESKENRIRVLNVMPQRGNIYDVNGKLLVTTRTAYTVAMIDLGEDKVRQSAEVLSQLLEIPAESIIAQVDNRERRAEAVQVAIDVDFAMVTKVMERSESLPGVYIDYLPIREYPYGSVLSHVLGYLSEISQDDLDTWATGQSYLIGDLVGRAGLERSYESILRGTNGGIIVEVDSQDNLIRVLERVEPVAGKDLHLTIDIELQQEAEALLENSLITIRSHAWGAYLAKEAYSGAFVMLENKTGRILAMASYPDFDPNEWELGVLKDEEKRIQYLIGSNEYPNAMLNRAVLAALPPGSIFKPITLAAALESGVVQRLETIQCKGYYDVLDETNAPKCWVYPSSHGWLNAEQALSHSCNAYFFEVGRRLGIDALDQYAEVFGLGEDTGFEDLLFESEANYQFTHRSNPEYKVWAYENYLISDEDWYEGETIFSAIGQQYSAFTPLQMASAMAQIANRGNRYAPALVDYMIDSEGNRVQIFQKSLVETAEFKDSTWETIHQGLVAVTQSGGTSERTYFGNLENIFLWKDLPFKVAAKTGTAQVANDPLDLKSHAWFSAYAPAEDPEITITMVIEAGRSGSSSCGPAISQMIRHYFDQTLLPIVMIEQ